MGRETHRSIPANWSATSDGYKGKVLDDVRGCYLVAAEYGRYGARMASCGGLPRFGWSTLKETGETRLRRREAHFCRVRHCPVCQWRRSLLWQARLVHSLPRIVAAYPSARGHVIPLTVRQFTHWGRGRTGSGMQQHLHRP
ncbi:protein rep, partial [Escherichia coli]|uniref:protein rep n=1 Tax=Escherichia coli TaxID=562 RepID=UPI003AF7DFD0